ncbi:hypothetical protein E2562_020472 [Oryza meyeriana var. granulata]|uniref:Uncharacterized protein n=1 Tax=Oryza meyeriana var. granulata TaxID=110450 RepID=A0A6G1D7H3_9ORYZ|nr:hypothetical protein E2562_020472 [Oryza meyeriana var. granulata]
MGAPGDEGFTARILTAFVDDFKENFRPMTLEELKQAGLAFSDERDLLEQVQITANNAIDLVTETVKNKTGCSYWASTLDVVKAEILLRQVLQEAELGGYVRKDALHDPTAMPAYQQNQEEYEVWEARHVFFANAVSDLEDVLGSTTDGE